MWDQKEGEEWKKEEEETQGKEREEEEIMPRAPWIFHVFSDYYSGQVVIPPVWSRSGGRFLWGGPPTDVQEDITGGTAGLAGTKLWYVFYLNDTDRVVSPSNGLGPVGLPADLQASSVYLSTWPESFRDGVIKDE